MRKTFYGWWIVLAGALIMITISGTFFYGFTAFVNPILDEYGWAYVTISIIFTLRNLEEGFLTPVAGFLADRFGPRKVLIAGISFVSLAYVLLSRTSGIGTFYAYYTLLAVAFSAVASTVLYTPLAHWFKRRLTFVLGLMGAGYGTSGVMVPILVWLISAYGWRSTFVIVGVMTLALGVPLALVMRHKPQPYGYLPDGDPPAAKPVQAADVKQDDEPDEGLTCTQALRTRALWILSAVFALSSLATNGMFVYMIPHLTSAGLSRELSGTVVSLMTVLSITGRLGFGWLGDRIDKRKALAVCYGMEMAGIMVFSQIREPWMIIPFLLIFAPGFGGTVPLVAAVQVDSFGARAFGTLRGLTIMASNLGGIPSPLLAGFMADRTGNFRAALLVLAAPLVAAIPLPLFLRRKPKRPGERQALQQTVH